jgi:signal transduction histidine kinase
VILSVTLAWRATVRLADARGHTRLLETEARHLRELSQAAAGLAHETRNPLGLIRGWTQRLAQSLPDNPQQHEQAQAVIEECDRVTARINQFLAFARPCEPKVAEVRLAEVIAELAGLLEPDLDAKHLMLARGLPRPDETMQADREMLRQALFNLLQNAVAFSPEGGSVEIAVRTGENSCRRIEVADRGPGVAREMVDLLFTPYHTTRSGGTGLGLAIVRRIATAHDWRAGYTPRPDGGSIFWLDGIHG